AADYPQTGELQSTCKARSKATGLKRLSSRKAQRESPTANLYGASTNPDAPSTETSPPQPHAQAENQRQSVCNPCYPWLLHRRLFESLQDFDGVRIVRIELEGLLVVLYRELALVDRHVGFAKTVVGVEALRVRLDVELEDLDRLFRFTGAQ